MIVGKPHYKHAPVLLIKKVTFTKLNNIKNVMRCRDSRSGKQGREDSIKLFSIQPHPTYLSRFDKDM